ncbi:MAG: hypothetical protein EHM42_04510, partial [Planctomycetaceae bacterium]
MPVSDLNSVLDYLLISPPDCFRWVDGGNAVAWRNGPTIVFRPELAEILLGQPDPGLPPLGAMLLVLSACRESWPASRLCLIAEMAAAGGIERRIPRWAADALTALDLVHAAPPTALKSVAGRAELLAYVFEGLPPLRSLAGVGSHVVEFLEDESSSYWVDYQDRAGGDLWRELSYMAQRLR